MSYLCNLYVDEYDVDEQVIIEIDNALKHFNYYNTKLPSTQTMIIIEVEVILNFDYYDTIKAIYLINRFIYLLNKIRVRLELYFDF